MQRASTRTPYTPSSFACHVTSVPVSPGRPECRKRCRSPRGRGRVLHEDLVCEPSLPNSSATQTRIVLAPSASWSVVDRRGALLGRAVIAPAVDHVSGRAAAPPTRTLKGPLSLCMPRNVAGRGRGPKQGVGYGIDRDVRRTRVLHDARIRHAAVPERVVDADADRVVALLQVARADGRDVLGRRAGVAPFLRLSSVRAAVASHAHAVRAVLVRVPGDVRAAVARADQRVGHVVDRDGRRKSCPCPHRSSPRRRCRTRRRRICGSCWRPRQGRRRPPWSCAGSAAARGGRSPPRYRSRSCHRPPARCRWPPLSACQEMSVPASAEPIRVSDTESTVTAGEVTSFTT